MNVGLFSHSWKRWCRRWISKPANVVIHIIPQVLYGFKGQERRTVDCEEICPARQQLEEISCRAKCLASPMRDVPTSRGPRSRYALLVVTFKARESMYAFTFFPLNRQDTFVDGGGMWPLWASKLSRNVRPDRSGRKFALGGIWGERVKRENLTLVTEKCWLENESR